MRPVWIEMGPLMVLFWVVFTACFLPEVIGGLLQHSGERDKRQDRGSMGALVGGIAASLALALNISVRWPGPNICADRQVMVWLGIVVMLLGLALRWYSIRVLGRFFTRDVAIREGHRIVRDGPYRYLRHPCYSGTLLQILGIGLVLDGWRALTVLAAVNAVGFGYRIAVEEAALRAAFGDEYLAYARATKRIVPLIY